MSWAPQMPGVNGSVLTVSVKPKACPFRWTGVQTSPWVLGSEKPKAVRGELGCWLQVSAVSE